MTYEQHLTQAGLTPHQATLYEALIRKGAMPASRAAREASVPRTLAYALLKQMEGMGLVERKEEKGKVALFSATHPLKLQERAEESKKRSEAALQALSGAMPELLSAYNLSIGKPGVRFFEGMLGMKQVLDDSLTAQETILTYADTEAIRRYIPEVNEAYVRERARRSIAKRALIPDTPVNRQFVGGYEGGFAKVTDAKFIACDKTPFSTIMQIYDSKVSYLALGDENLVGVIIEDPRIYAMHKTLFEHLWAITPAPSSDPIRSE